MNEENLALNNQQGFIFHKMQPIQKFVIYSKERNMNFEKWIKSEENISA